jgi:hypothetical protein
VTIQDNESVQVVFDAASSSAAEAGGGHPVPLRLVAAAGVTLAVPVGADVIDAGSGAATSGSDYGVFGTQTVTFPAGSGDGATEAVNLSVLDDLLLEGDEDVDLQTDSVSGPGASIGPQSTHEVTITDDETVQVVFDAASSSAAEAGGGHPVLLRLIAAAGVTLAVPVGADVIDVGSGAATSGSDYGVFGTQTVTFPAGSGNGATQPVTVDVLDDLLLEGDEDVDLQIDSVTGPGASIGAPSTHEVTITDDETVEVVFDAASSSAAEAGGGHPVPLRLVAAAGVTLAVPVTADVIDAGSGAATSGSDYGVFGTQTVTFPAGSGDGATEPVSLTVLDDLLLEGDEDVDLSIDSVSGPGASIGLPSTHEVTIQDDETVEVVFDAASSSAAEAGGGHPVELRLVAASGVTLSVPVGADVIDVGSGAATSGSDYGVFGTQTVTFSAGSGNGDTAPVSLSILDDLLLEGDEDVDLSIDSVSGPGASIGLPSTHEVTITDDEPELTTTPANTGTLDFGNVRIGTTSMESITLTNTGFGPLSGTFSAASGSAFGPAGSLAFGPLNPGQSTSRDYTYTPTDRNLDLGMVTVTSNGGTSTINLAGDGVGPEFDGLPPAGSLIDFGDVAIATTASLPLDITNLTPDGDLGLLTDLTVISASITGSDAGEFSLSGFAAGTVLPATGVLNLFVDFTPMDPLGLKFAILTFLTDQEAPFGSSGLSFSYDLQGNAVPEPSTLLLLIFCLLGVSGVRWRRRK